MADEQKPLSKNRARPQQAWLRRVGWLFLTAIVLRLAVVSVLLTHNPPSWGVNEAAGIARGLLLGHGFASPFHDAAGPTAWLAPVYPGILAGIFLVFGVQTATSVWVAVLLNVLFSSATAIVVLQLGREHFGETTGLVAAWAWAISPPVVVMPWLPWETSLSALVMTFAFHRTLRLNHTSSWSRWAICGGIWSFAALLNPALLAPLPAIAARAAWARRYWTGPVIMLLVCALGIMPWTARNWISLHKLVPVRSNFWAEVYFRNVSFSLHPTGNSMVYQKEGEIAFVADLRGKVVGHVRSHLRDFAVLTGQRIYAFWTQPAPFGPYGMIASLAAVSGIVVAFLRGRTVFPFLLILAFYPLVYYVTYTFARYRHPIEPLMYTLAGYAACELADYGRLAARAGG